MVAIEMVCGFIVSGALWIQLNRTLRDPTSTYQPKVFSHELAC